MAKITNPQESQLEAPFVVPTPEYLVVEAHSAPMLTERVNDKLKKGWELHRGFQVVVNNGRTALFQVLVKRG